MRVGIKCLRKSVRHHVGCSAVNKSSAAVCSSDVGDTMSRFDVCGIYDSFQARQSTVTCTVHYLKSLTEAVFKLVQLFSLSVLPLAFPLVFTRVPECGCVQPCWNISHMVGKQRVSFCVAQTFAWIHLYDVN